MRTLLIADTHFNHGKIATYCDRPANFTDILIKNWNERVKFEDTVIHLGDVAIGSKTEIKDILSGLTGRKILIRGNHDRQKSNSWWMDNGFDFSCDGILWRDWWLTHEPTQSFPNMGYNCLGNIHGHLHNVFHGFHEGTTTRITKLNNPWQRLFSVEYTNYCPIEFQEFIDRPDKYNARGIK